MQSTTALLKKNGSRSRLHTNGHAAPTKTKPESNCDALELRGKIEAIDKVQAVIEFELDGTIITANENFLKTVGYRLDEIKGQHHGMFVETAYRASAEYKQFWRDLGEGKFQSAEYKRIGKGGREIWIQASYNPIFDINGRPFKVVKFATDVTASKLQNADYQGQIAAIGKSQVTY
jgi:methyl-accepting chemotaxis protein